MSIQIDQEAMFKEALISGINLFTGAGFSKLPDANGKTLPDAAELCGEICEKFSISAAYSNDLERLMRSLPAHVKFKNILGKNTLFNHTMNCMTC